MLFRREILEGIARGAVTLAFRRWKRPTVKAGGSVRTAAGVVRIGRVEKYEKARLTEQDAKASGLASLAALEKMLGPDDGNPIYRIELADMGKDSREALRNAASPTTAEWKAIETRFQRWQRASPGYFPKILAVIAGKPAVAAAELASEFGVEKLKFKQDVRKLKELGLTESLEVGYRLSPRGETVLARLRGLQDT